MFSWIQKHHLEKKKYTPLLLTVQYLPLSPGRKGFKMLSTLKLSLFVCVSCRESFQRVDLWLWKERIQQRSSQFFSVGDEIRSLTITCYFLNSEFYIYIFMFFDSILEVLAVPSKGKDKCWEYTQCMQQLTILLGILMP